MLAAFVVVGKFLMMFFSLFSPILVYILKFNIVKDTIISCINTLRCTLETYTYEKLVYDAEAIASGDAYVDAVLNDMFGDRFDEYDPYEIEDGVIGFNKKIAFVNFNGEAKLHNVYINGLRTTHRMGFSSLQEENGKLNVKANLSTGVLTLHSSGCIKVMNFGPTINFFASVAYAEVHLGFTVDSETGKDGKLEKFIIGDVRGMTAKVTNLGFLNWAVNFIIFCIIKSFESPLRKFLQNTVQKHIAENMPNFQFPVRVTSPEKTDPTIAETEMAAEPINMEMAKRQIEIEPLTTEMSFGPSTETRRIVTDAIAGPSTEAKYTLEDAQVTMEATGNPEQDSTLGNNKTGIGYLEDSKWSGDSMDVSPEIEDIVKIGDIKYADED